MKQDFKFLVCTQCFTFNHASFINNALNGFTRQKTTFPFVNIIVDDASIDGEQRVIQRYLSDYFQEPYHQEETEYARIVCAQHKTNLNCFFVVFFLKYNHYSIKKPKWIYLKKWIKDAKYYAICEGDDYWINPLKIQMQVDFMESHLDYGMCYCNYKIIDESQQNKYIKDADTGPYTGIANLLLKNNIATLTTMFRSELYFSYLDDIVPSNKGWRMGDYPLWLWIGFHSNIHYIEEVVAVYRILPESASHSKDYKTRLAFQESSREVRMFFAEKYGIQDEVKVLINDCFWREQANVLRRNDKKAYKKALKSINNKTLKDYLKIALPCCYPFY